MAFSWGTPISLKGSDGARGLSFVRTDGKPTDTGSEGEARIDPTAFVIYTFVSGQWVASQSFAGVAGMAGPVDYFAVGNRVPDASTYSGDGQGFYILNPGSEIYLYSKEKGWYDAGYSLKGEVGDQGVAGVRGSYRYVQNGPPPTDTSGLDPQPLKGDEWIDTGTAGGPYVSYWQ